MKRPRGEAVKTSPIGQTAQPQVPATAGENFDRRVEDQARRRSIALTAPSEDLPQSGERARS